MKILIIDDDSDIIKSFQIGLENFPYNVYYCTNPEIAIQLSRITEFDLIISDIRMPNMNGIEMIKIIKNINYKAKIILMTAFEELHSAIESIKKQVYAFLLKPIDIHEIILNIEKINKENNRNAFLE